MLMKGSSRAALTAALAACCVATPVGAEPSKAQKRTYDPNEKVCEKIQVLGSRLAVKRVCATRAEWAARRQSDRETTEIIQTRMVGPCSVINSHTGAPAC